MYLVGNESGRDTVSEGGHDVEVEPLAAAVIGRGVLASTDLSTLCQPRFLF